MCILLKLDCKQSTQKDRKKNTQIRYQTGWNKNNTAVKGHKVVQQQTKKKMHNIKTTTLEWEKYGTDKITVDCIHRFTVILEIDKISGPSCLKRR